MPRIRKNCEACGDSFEAWSVPSKTEPRYCSQKCWLTRHNNQERNAKVARETAKQRGDKLRGRGAGKTYVKRDGRHEHRVVMEEKIGRPLQPGEIVHHKDENKQNNDPENLDLMSGQNEHAIHHMLKMHAEGTVPKPYSKKKASGSK